MLKGQQGGEQGGLGRGTQAEPDQVEPDQVSD